MPENWEILPRVDRHPFSLELCLASGQSFAWRCSNGVWTGTIRDVGLVLKQLGDEVLFITSKNNAETIDLLSHYLAFDEDHAKITETFPKDDFLIRAVKYCGGLRVLRQDPWECLAGFILSSTKQIVHIQQIWTKLCHCWGEKIELANGSVLHSFPTADQIARCSDRELRDCAMGFRAPYLLAAAKKVASGELVLKDLKKLPVSEAREKLVELHGVGRKIADCVLLFSLDHPEAFPVDTWILKVLKTIYFKKKRNVTSKRLLEFTETYFGPYAGHAQQYLFHYARMNPGMFRK